MERLKIGLFNDSFPPTIDGVAQTVKNYAAILHQNHCDVTVVTPKYKGAVDAYPFEVFRYQSIPLDSRIGYRAGNPFNPDTLIKLRKKKFDLIHVHAPFASSVLAANVNHRPRVPTVLTYHTKFDIDIAKRVPLDGMRKIAMKFLLDNINAVDEVWVVTEGCGKALRNIGYKGGYTVMENGTDFAYGRAKPEQVAELREKYAVPEDRFVFLFVGRMMWYKNVRLILDSVKLLKGEGVPFTAFFVETAMTPRISGYMLKTAGSKKMPFSPALFMTGNIYGYFIPWRICSCFPPPTILPASSSKKLPPVTALPSWYGGAAPPKGFPIRCPAILPRKIPPPVPKFFWTLARIVTPSVRWGAMPASICIYPGKAPSLKRIRDIAKFSKPGPAPCPTTQKASGYKVPDQGTPRIPTSDILLKAELPGGIATGTLRFFAMIQPLPVPIPADSISPVNKL